MVESEEQEQPFISHLVKPNRFEALEYYRRVASTWELKINLYEKVNKVIRDNETLILIDYN